MNYSTYENIHEGNSENNCFHNYENTNQICTTKNSDELPITRTYNYDYYIPIKSLEMNRKINNETMIAIKPKMSNSKYPTNHKYQKSEFKLK